MDGNQATSFGTVRIHSRNVPGRRIEGVCTGLAVGKHQSEISQPNWTDN
jgi:hypothetical protein